MDRLQAVSQRQLRAGHAHVTIYTNTSIDVEFTSHMLIVKCGISHSRDLDVHLIHSKAEQRTPC